MKERFVCVYLRGREKGGRGFRFTVLSPPNCSHDLPFLAGLYTRRPPRDISEQQARYSAQALSTVLCNARDFLIISTSMYISGNARYPSLKLTIWEKLSCPRTD